MVRPEHVRPEHDSPGWRAAFVPCLTADTPVTDYLRESACRSVIKTGSTKSRAWRGGAQCLGIGRAEEEDVLPRDHGAERAVDDVSALGEAGVEIVAELLDRSWLCVHLDSVVEVGRQGAARDSGRPLTPGASDCRKTRRVGARAGSARVPWRHRSAGDAERSACVFVMAAGTTNLTPPSLAPRDLQAGSGRRPLIIGPTAITFRAGSPFRPSPPRSRRSSAFEPRAATPRR